MENGNEVALNIAYGVPTLTKGIWYYSTKFGYFINDENYKSFKYIMIFLASIYAFFIFLIKFKFGDKLIMKTISLEEKLFICGGGIFIGRFINFSNADYALIFLIFTISDSLSFCEVFFSFFFSEITIVSSPFGSLEKISKSSTFFLINSS